jgi:hypothetical protein
MSKEIQKTHFLLLIFALFFCFVDGSVFADNTENDVSVALEELGNANAAIRERAAGKILVFFHEDKLGEKRDDAILGLKYHLKDPEKRVRHETATTLALIDSSTEAIPVLIEMLREGGTAAGRAAQSLGRIGEAANSAVPALIETMKTKSEFKNWFVFALEDIGTPEALEAIKPYKQNLERRKKLVKPISMIANSLIGSSLMILSFVGLYWWNRVRRRKWDKIISWSLLVPVPFWGLCVYDVFYVRSHPPVITSFDLEFYFYVLLFIMTLTGIIPWLLSLLWGRWQAGPTAPTML